MIRAIALHLLALSALVLLHGSLPSYKRGGIRLSARRKRGSVRRLPAEV